MSHRQEAAPEPASSGRPRPADQSSTRTRRWNLGRACKRPGSTICAGIVLLLLSSCQAASEPGGAEGPALTEPAAQDVRATEAALPTADPTRSSGPPPPGDAPAVDAELEGPIWLLTGMGAEGIAPLPGSQPSLQLQAGGVGGNAGCNTFAGSYRLERGGLVFEGLAMTEMMCTAPSGIMEQESRYLSALQATRSYEHVEGRLTLLDAQGLPLARFER